MWYEFIKRMDAIRRLGPYFEDDEARALHESMDILSRTSEEIILQSEDILRDIHDNWESATILALASIGVAFLLKNRISKVPLPPFLEKKMVVPVISVLIVKTLCESAEWRSHVDKE